MMTRQDLTLTMPWMRAGTDFFAEQLAKLSDEQLAEPSLLPGWTRAHVVGHVARNAEALGRLAAWARTGVETPMYTDAQQRSADIEASATEPAGVLRADVASTAADLDAALSALDDAAWRAEVRSALGRAMPALDIPWMRIREVWLHAIDLGAGAQLDDLPAGVIDTLLDDATGMFSGRDNAPAVRLVPTDRVTHWLVHEDDPATVTVEGTAVELAGWLIGRTDGGGLRVASDAPLPPIPAWI